MITTEWVWLDVGCVTTTKSFAKKYTLSKDCSKVLFTYVVMDNTKEGKAANQIALFVSDKREEKTSNLWGKEHFVSVKADETECCSIYIRINQLEDRHGGEHYR